MLCGHTSFDRLAQLQHSLGKLCRKLCWLRPQGVCKGAKSLQAVHKLQSLQERCLASCLACALQAASSSSQFRAQSDIQTLGDSLFLWKPCEGQNLTKRSGYQWVLILCKVSRYHANLSGPLHNGYAMPGMLAATLVAYYIYCRWHLCDLWQGLAICNLCICRFWAMTGMAIRRRSGADCAWPPPLTTSRTTNHKTQIFRVVFRKLTPCSALYFVSQSNLQALRQVRYRGPSVHPT